MNQLRNGRSFSTRQVITRQSGGAILTLSTSFQSFEQGPETLSPEPPEGVAHAGMMPAAGDGALVGGRAAARH